MRVVANGEALLAPSITRRVIADYPQRVAPRKIDTGLNQLTERELAVLRLLATGKSNAEIAAHLYLGEGTVRTHVSHVLGKLGPRDRVPDSAAATWSTPGRSRMRAAAAA